MILSIQSAVCFGYVGNNAATLPLMYLGHQVNTIHTVLFSNHTGYPNVKGLKLSGDQFQDIVDGLKANDLLSLYTCVLSGYVGNASTLLVLRQTIIDMRKSNSKLLYVMDTVLGDNDSLYVPKELIPVYKSMLPLADIITPNLFELQRLTDGIIMTVIDAQAALRTVHGMGVKYVVMTSMSINQDFLTLVGSVREHESGVIRQFSITFPKIHQNFTGTGDTFTGLLLGYLLETELSYESFKIASEKTVSTIHSIIQATFNEIQEAGYTEESFEQLPKQVKMRMRELNIIKCRANIENPVIMYKALQL